MLRGVLTSSSAEGTWRFLPDCLVFGVACWPLSVCVLWCSLLRITTTSEFGVAPVDAAFSSRAEPFAVSAVAASCIVSLDTVTVVGRWS